MLKPNLRFTRKPRSPFSRWLVPLIILVVVLGGVWSLHHWYFSSLRPVSANHSIVYFTVSPGESSHQIAKNLQQTHLIRSSRAFETYLRSKETPILQAGTYKFSQSMSVQEIVHAMVVGDVAKNLLTVLPGKRLDQIKQAFAKAGYSQSEIDSAFDAANYAGHPALASLPRGASLEGFLYPDSFQKETTTPASTIVTESLDEMEKHLSDQIIGGFGPQGLSVYQGVILASIVVQESGDPASQPIIAQVFLSRLKQNMMLGSDVTAFYASAIAGQKSSVSIDSPYNTRLYPGLPPGPIGNVTASALNAVAHPASTDYLYFVAGDDGKLHFSHTQAEHDQAVAQYCHKGCSQ